MPLGETTEGATIIASARDIGNMTAGYVAAANKLPWTMARLGFDAYQIFTNGKFEQASTTNAEWIGWKLGYTNTSYFEKGINYWKSIINAPLDLYNHLQH